MRIERNDLIFQPSEGVQCHASHLTPLADGGVLAVWFQGSREGADDVCIWGARFSPDGKWSETRPHLAGGRPAALEPRAVPPCRWGEILLFL